MAVIRDIKIKNSSGTYDTYDIGADATNVKYDNSKNVKQKIDSLTPIDIGAIGISQIGLSGGVAGLDNTGKVPSSQLPTMGTAAAKDFTTSVTSGSVDLVTSGAVWTAIDNLPEPMIYQGTLGTGGTITTLPAASTSNTGYTYKVITDGTYDSQVAKLGDIFISNGSTWTLVPSGDENIPVQSVNGYTGAVSLNASDVGAAATSHTHTKSQITDFPASMPASDVYSWAKAATKPSYTASEVGALASNGTAANSSKLGGYSAASTATGNTVALRNSSGYLYATFFNSSNAVEDPLNYSFYLPFFDTNGWLRKSTYSNLKNSIGLSPYSSNSISMDGNGEFYASNRSQFKAKNGVDIQSTNGDIWVWAKTGISVYLQTEDMSFQSATGKHIIKSTGTYNYNQSGGGWGPIYASQFSVQSSRKVKKNIEDMTEEEANKLFELRPVKYDYINEEDASNCYGLIAEEVQDVGIDYPISMIEKKTENEETGEEEIEEIPALDYSKFVPYLIKVCQMQQREIDELKATVNELKEKIKD